MRIIRMNAKEALCDAYIDINIAKHATFLFNEKLNASILFSTNNCIIYMLGRGGGGSGKGSSWCFFFSLFTHFRHQSGEKCIFAFIMRARIYFARAGSDVQRVSVSAESANEFILFVDWVYIQGGIENTRSKKKK